jgi:hypothetical protein
MAPPKISVVGGWHTHGRARRKLGRIDGDLECPDHRYGNRVLELEHVTDVPVIGLRPLVRPVLVLISWAVIRTWSPDLRTLPSST